MRGEKEKEQREEEGEQLREDDERNITLEMEDSSYDTSFNTSDLPDLVSQDEAEEVETVDLEDLEKERTEERQKRKRSGNIKTRNT